MFIFYFGIECILSKNCSIKSEKRNKTVYLEFENTVLTKV